MVLVQFIIQEPDGPMSFWLSIIPLTSPVVMMVRIPFGVPYFQVFLSMALLVLGFLGTTWIAARIYRTGILMYGKKDQLQGTLEVAQVLMPAIYPAFWSIRIFYASSSHSYGTHS